MTKDEGAAVLVVVNATVAADREAELIAGYRDLSARALPDGLLRAELLRGQNGTWRIQSLWRDMASLRTLADSGEPPAALELLRRVGAEHTHDVFEVEHFQTR